MGQERQQPWGQYTPAALVYDKDTSQPRPDGTPLAAIPSKVEARAIHLMRKLHSATGGKPQHWETLDNLGAVQADAAAIVYAVEKG